MKNHGAKKLNIAIIGAGKIGSAIAVSLQNHYNVVATRRRKIKDNLINGTIPVTRDNRQAASNADIIIVTVKPGQIIRVLQNIKDEVKGKPVISFAAAIPISMLKKAAPESQIIRAMTNIAVMAQSSYTVYAFSDNVTDENKKIAVEIFSKFGASREVDEKYIDAMTALSGSGPAYLYTVIEALTYGGLLIGLPRDIAMEAVAHTFIGTAKLLLSSKNHPAELKDMVVTPGGVTIEGIYELEDSRVRTAMMKAISAAFKKSKIIAEDIQKDSMKLLEE